jgi:hypothetical protein
MRADVRKNVARTLCLCLQCPNRIIGITFRIRGATLPRRTFFFRLPFEAHLSSPLVRPVMLQPGNQFTQQHRHSGHVIRNQP